MRGRVLTFSLVIEKNLRNRVKTGSNFEISFDHMTGENRYD